MTFVKIITDEKCAGYSSPGHPERPARITDTRDFLRGQNELPVVWAAPTSVDESQILRAHSPQHLARLNEPEDFDGDTPYHENISTFARASVAAALDALKAARAGENVFGAVAVMDIEIKNGDAFRSGRGGFERGYGDVV